MREVKQTKFTEDREMTLEEQIKYYRKQAGLSQEKMAEKIGVCIMNRCAIRWKTDDSGVPLAHLAR